MNLIKLFSGACVALAMVVPVTSAEQAIIVLDGSGSMWAQVDGTPRIGIARDTLSEVLSTLPSELELGLMAYGHREKGNCGDIELLVAPASGTAAAINAAAAKINPKGMTPLSDAVRLAAEELRYTEDAATVILITDGLETCEVDPCALGNELEAQGVNFTTHVLGFGLTDEEGRQVACLAENTGGKYFSADDGAGLVDALGTAVAEVAQAPEPEPAPEPAPVEHEFNLVPQAVLAEGVPYHNELGQLVWEVHAVAATGVGERLQTEYDSGAKFNVEPGDYYLRATLGGATVEQKISVGDGELAEPVVNLNAGLVKVRAVTSEGETPNSNTQIRISYGDDRSIEFGEGIFRLPAGPLEMEVTHDTVTYTEEFSLTAGEILEKDINLHAGFMEATAIYAEGVDVTSNQLRYGLMSARKSIDGRREEIDVEYDTSAKFYAAPGDYILKTDFEAVSVETPITIVDGERLDLVVNLNAGVAAFTAPGVERMAIYEAGLGIDGTRREVTTKYDVEWQYAFAEGDYVAVGQFADDVEYEVPFTVIAGERVEVEVSEAAAAAAGIAADQPASSAPAAEPTEGKKKTK
ncbi:VWA domain-containing protein [Devosia sp. MC532]|uniref:vWA domain-containing protein n=1 Tax=Devosia sp. MC532 TaxID=2799788 RepID=UPI0018F590A3|nr:VWA domain-containing protein [Devosia sp. MC532]MBJ7577140.1 VWA domain-containing protein [Devosia sp. MC532]